MSHHCNDCRMYLPVDVFKGLCKKQKTGIRPEDPQCDLFEKMPKCKFCAMYTEDGKDIGKCNMKAMTYPDLPALHCTAFQWIQ